MEEQLNPQTVIDELVKRVQALTIENVVLSARLASMTKVAQEVTVIGDDAQE